MSCLSLGPREGSYNPPAFGLLRSSRRVGLTICLTEMRRTSSVVRKENEMLATVDGMACEMFMATIAYELEERSPGGAGRETARRTERRVKNARSVQYRPKILICGPEQRRALLIDVVGAWVYHLCGAAQLASCLLYYISENRVRFFSCVYRARTRRGIQ